jgi:hypothetical protein
MSDETETPKGREDIVKTGYPTDGGGTQPKETEPPPGIEDKPKTAGYPTVG